MNLLKISGYFSVVLNWGAMLLWIVAFNSFDNHRERVDYYNNVIRLNQVVFDVSRLLLTILSLYYFHQTISNQRVLKIIMLTLQYIALFAILWSHM